MSVALEQTIMAEVGFHSHYNWYNGSGSCVSIRERAVHLLAGAIQEQHDAGGAIAAPDYTLIDLAKRAVAEEDSQYGLTLTWRVVSDVIRAHMQLDSVARHQTARIIGEQYGLKKNYRDQAKTFNFSDALGVYGQHPSKRKV